MDAEESDIIEYATNNSTAVVVRGEIDNVSIKRSLFELEPKAQVEKATEIANALYDVIEKQKLYSIIQGKKYVKVEGWELLGTFLGILPRERAVSCDDAGNFEASVDLIRASDGCVVGGASAICGVDEKRWTHADRYARRSMAITRAIGKAYRCSFSWIVCLAGYEATPEEEIPKEERVNASARTDSAPGDFDPNPPRGSSKAASANKTAHSGEGVARGIYKSSPEEDKKLKVFLKEEYGIDDEDRLAVISSRLDGRPKKDIVKIIAEVNQL